MTRIRLAAVLIFALLLVSCATEPKDIPYQFDGEARTGRAGAVETLQRQAVAALQQQSFTEAIEYLQRAIRIEPRDPRSWHYLAQAYWQRKDYDRCLEMVERSFSYSRAEDGLDEANRQLKARCRDG